MDTDGWDVYIRSGIYGFIFIFGIVGNIFVMFFFGYKMKRAPNFRWFVIHLAIADCTYAVLSPVQLLYLMFSDGYWHLGAPLCKLSYIGPITINVSALLLCFMAYERYRAICHPFKERLSKRLINIIVVGIWILCVLLKVPVMNRLEVNQNQCLMLSSNDVEHVLIALSFLVFESILPLILLTIFFFRITYALREHDNFRNHSDSTAFLERHRRRSSTPSYYSGMGAPPTPKWKPPLSPPPLVILEECDDDDAILDYVNFGHRRGEGADIKNRVHFAFSRGRLYSGNSSCAEDVFESVPPTPNPDVLSPAENTNSSTSEDTASSSKNLLHSEAQHHSHLTENLRTSYLHLRQFVKHSHIGSHLDVGRHFGIRNKKDRDTISALFYSVVMFAVTSVPYNLNYFIITCVYLYSSDVDNIDAQYGTKLVMLNEWLGVIMMSGCIMNIIIYSGKFPQFRFQMYIWVTNFGRKISMNTWDRGSCKEMVADKDVNNTSYCTQSVVQTYADHHCVADIECRPDGGRTENDYVKV